MLIKNIDNNKIIITLLTAIGNFRLQRVIDYVKYLEATAKSAAKQSDIDQLADDVNAEWWQKNKSRFISC